MEKKKNDVQNDPYKYRKATFRLPTHNGAAKFFGVKVEVRELRPQCNDRAAR